MIRAGIQGLHPAFDRDLASSPQILDNSKGKPRYLEAIAFQVLERFGGLARQSKIEEASMRKHFVLAIFGCLIFSGCGIDLPDAKANVVLSSGPFFRDGSSSSAVWGNVKNVGNWGAQFIEVYGYLCDAAGKKIATGGATFNYLGAGQTYAFSADFPDEDRTIRNKMYSSRTVCKITWKEYQSE